MVSADARHFGKKIIAKRTEMTEEDPKVEILWLRLYKVCTPVHEAVIALT